ncbi:MAG: hypothetical protein Sylvanvirus10_28 [Sylvanvirus sp.]|uniref:Uncharacterized protein n=1 Tax=Sylvanvirus sp. TaxID=2487774 RepID=A0A3G5AJS6_9VIRU|nr:MAG: hypothetical protein Sylvanvirus10_28 [Sylvanvirus sp.]
MDFFSRCITLWTSLWLFTQNIVYKLTRSFGRNDYLYLVHMDYMWYLQMKLYNQEEVGELNRYTCRHTCFFNDSPASVYVTPLHEAIETENLFACILLSKAGADPRIPITSGAERDKMDLSKTWDAGCVCSHRKVNMNEVNIKIQEWYKKFNVGRTSIELAKAKLDRVHPKVVNLSCVAIHQYINTGKIKIL